MDTQRLISVAVEAGYEVIEYDNHFCLKHNLKVEIVVTVPKVTTLVPELFQKIKDILGL